MPSILQLNNPVEELSATKEVLHRKKRHHLIANQICTSPSLTYTEGKKNRWKNFGPRFPFMKSHLASAKTISIVFLEHKVIYYHSYKIYIFLNRV